MLHATFEAGQINRPAGQTRIESNGRVIRRAVVPSVIHRVNGVVRVIVHSRAERIAGNIVAPVGRIVERFAQRNLQSKLKDGLEADTFPISSFAHRPPPCHPKRSAAESKDLEAALDVASCLFQPQAFAFRDPSTRSLAPSVRMTTRGTVSIRRQAATFAHRG